MAFSTLRQFLHELRRRRVYRVAAVYVLVAWVLLQLGNIVVEPLRLPEWTMPLLIVLMVMGFPLALVLAWAFDITPQGVRRAEPMAAAPRSGEGWGSRSRIGGAAGVGILIGVVGLGFYGYVKEPETSALGLDQRAEDLRPLAVLPFANTSPDPDNEYFSDGITEELLTTLSSISGLRVISRTSAMRYKDSNKSIQEIGDELGVDHIVEGSVRRVGDRVRISVQLVDTHTDHRLWADSYDRSVEDIFAIQREIASTIVNSLRTALPGARLPTDAPTAAPTDHVEAYQLYLQGRHLVHTRFRTAGGYRGILESVDLFERAVALDPGFARAWSALGSAYSLLRNDPGASASPEHFETRATAAIQRALDLDPSIGEAHAVLGLMDAAGQRWGDAERRFRRALTEEPQFATTYLWYGILLVSAGRSRDAQEILFRGTELDPMNAITAHWLADALRNDGRLEDSRIHAQRSFDLGMASSGMGVFIYHTQRGEWEEAVAFQERVARAEGFDPAYVRPLVDAIRDPAMIPAAVAALDEVAAANPAFEPAWFQFDLQAPDLIFDDVEAMFERGAGLFALWRMWEPQNTHLRNHPRFRDLAHRVGLVDYWRQGAWPDLCRPDRDSFTCR